jgi:hypothetical protein
MKKPRKDPVRENRIHEEASVDAYESEEKAMSWYYYLEDKLGFPFRANVRPRRSHYRGRRVKRWTCSAWRRTRPV